MERRRRRGSHTNPQPLESLSGRRASGPPGASREQIRRTRCRSTSGEATRPEPEQLLLGLDHPKPSRSQLLLRGQRMLLLSAGLGEPPPLRGQLPLLIVQRLPAPLRLQAIRLLGFLVQPHPILGFSSLSVARLH